MKKSLLGPISNRLTSEEFRTQRRKIVVNLREIMEENDVGLREAQIRIPRDVPGKGSIKYYMKNTNTNKKQYQKNLRNNGKSVKECIDSDTRNAFFPLKVLESVNVKKIEKDSFFKDVGKDYSINLFEVRKGKLHMKQFTPRRSDDRVSKPKNDILKAPKEKLSSIKIEVAISDILKEPKQKLMDVNIEVAVSNGEESNTEGKKASEVSFRSDEPKLQETQTFIESEIIINPLKRFLHDNDKIKAQSTIPVSSVEESQSTILTSVGQDDNDLHPANFERLESYLIDDIIFPNLHKILKDNNALPSINSENLTKDGTFSQISQDNPSASTVLKDLINEAMTQDAKPFPKKTSKLKPKREIIYFDDEHITDNIAQSTSFTNFMKEYVIDTPLEKNLVNHESMRFTMALKFTEHLINKSRFTLERSPSGGKRRLLHHEHKRDIHYFGNFGYIDGIDLSNMFPLLISKSTFSEETHCTEFQALSHMCDLKSLMAKAPLFSKSEPTEVMLNPIESSLKQLLIVSNTMSSDRSLESLRNSSLGSVDDKLVIAFKERVLNSASELSVESDEK